MMYTQELKNAAASTTKKNTNSYFEDALILQVVKDLKANSGMMRQKLTVQSTVAD